MDPLCSLADLQPLQTARLPVRVLIDLTVEHQNVDVLHNRFSAERLGVLAAQVPAIVAQQDEPLTTNPYYEPPDEHNPVSTSVTDGEGSETIPQQESNSSARPEARPVATTNTEPQSQQMKTGAENTPVPAKNRLPSDLTEEQQAHWLDRFLAATKIRMPFTLGEGPATFIEVSLTSCYTSQDLIGRIEECVPPDVRAAGWAVKALVVRTSIYDVAYITEASSEQYRRLVRKLARSEERTSMATRIDCRQAEV